MNVQIGSDDRRSLTNMFLSRACLSEEVRSFLKAEKPVLLPLFSLRLLCSIASPVLWPDLSQALDLEFSPNFHSLSIDLTRWGLIWLGYETP